MRASPLSRATPAALLGPGRHPVDDPADGGQRHAALAQGRQDMFDVAQEQRVGPDDEHALALERETVGVEQIGGPVQRHRRLARPGAALHDEHPGEVGPDDLVLLPLDGRDDVPHEPRAGPLQHRQQGGRAPQLEFL